MDHSRENCQVIQGDSDDGCHEEKCSANDELQGDDCSDSDLSSKGQEENDQVMKQKQSYLHQIGFFERDKDGNSIEKKFKPVDFSTITLDDLGLDEANVYDGDDDFGAVQDLQNRAKQFKWTKWTDVPTGPKQIIPKMPPRR